ncbi:hypothetical protein PoB_003407100 [Plakobranchus ocellatus]|uniref:Uncharacterized protein n=1 Tax=Plakobranchus ocellatus TaxID=259542 RepID=A0AAV4AGZ0_9GAST|nr:hypothetical protein PoB_003407100 [Plakobranchus ocellatus]
MGGERDGMMERCSEGSTLRSAKMLGCGLKPPSRLNPTKVVIFQRTKLFMALETEKAGAPVMGHEPVTERSVHISARFRYPVCHQHIPSS